MSYEITCGVDSANTGHLKACENTLVAPTKLILVPKGFSFATQTLAETLASWATAIKSDTARIFPLPEVDVLTVEDQENKVADRVFKGTKFVSGGKRGFTMMLDVNKYVSKQLYKLSGRAFDCFIVDANENIHGISTDGVKFEGIGMLSFQVLPQPTPDGTDFMMTPVKVVLSDPDKWMRYGVFINPTWSPINDLDGVYNVVLTVTSNWSATGGNVRVTYEGSGLPVTGLVGADFTIPGKSITSATPSGDGGDYAIVSSGLSTSTINLVACASISLTDIAIESTSAEAFTVS